MELTEGQLVIAKMLCGGNVVSSSDHIIRMRCR